MRLRAILVGMLGAASRLVAPAQAAPANPSPIPWAQIPLSYQPDLASDEGGLWMIGSKAEVQLRTSPLLVKDPTLNAYLNRVVCRLAGAYCSSIRLYVLDIPRVNAVMAPNGMLQIWTGFLLRAQNEAQLSFVLGHEISHYLLGHSIAQYRRLRDQAGAIAVVGALTGGLGSLAALGLRDSANAFSREEERQADTRGFELAIAAGYDPAQSVELWQEELDEEAVMPKSSDFQELAANHPPTADRVTSMKSMAAAAQPPKAHWETGTQSYQAVIRPFRMQWLAENLALAHFDESLAMLQALMKSEPHSSALHYYLGEVYRRRNANGDAAKALAAYHEAVADADAPGEAWRGLGLVSLKSGDNGAARTALQRYLTATPTADDRNMIEFYLSQISEAQ